jgi:uncharacterized protein YcbK (DUF882 family)
VRKYFLTWEFFCRCGEEDCDAAPMQEEFLEKLERLRRAWGRPLSPTSARRCKRHNEKVGGVPKSQHLFGNACDFNFRSAEEARLFAALAERQGFSGIGLGEILVHVDNRKTKAKWFYHN